MIVHPNFEQYTAISSVYGKIEQILFLYPSGKSDVTLELIQKRYGPILAELGDRRTYVFLAFTEQRPGTTEWLSCQENTVQTFEEALNETNLNARHHIIGIFSPLKGKRYSEWAQDAFLVAERNGVTVLVEPYSGQNEGMEYIAEQVAAVADAFVKPTYLQFDGGNILVGDDYALIGRNELKKNQDAFYPNDPDYEEKITQEFCRLLGVRYIIWIGANSPLELGINLNTGEQDLQPLFHIDLFVTLGGLSVKGEEVVLVADIQLDSTYLQGPWKDYSEGLDKLNQSLDAIANFLEEYHKNTAGPEFKVIRVPMGLIVETREDEEGNEHDTWTPISFNNALVEDYRGVKRIFVPKYPGWDALHKEFIREIAHDFTSIHKIEFEFDEYARNGGSLHCLVKVLKRKR